MLHLYHSNRLEALLILLCNLRATQPLRDPISAETVLVANPGIGRWLNLQIADRESIAANIDYHLPATFIWQLYRDCLADVPEHSQFEKPVMRFRLLSQLATARDTDSAVWQPLRHYLAADDPMLADAKLAQLATRISDVFDQYLVYRPQMLLDWEQGSDRVPGQSATQAWQPALWRALTAAVREPHRARLWARFCAAADRGDLDPAHLPEHLHVFNVGLLPPSTLDVLVRLARVGREAAPDRERVSVYFLNPSVDYWADLVDLRRAARDRLKLGGNPTLSDDETGNPLLASFGASGKTLLQLLGERSDWVHDEQFFLPSETASLLSAVQRDLLHPFDAPDLHNIDLAEESPENSSVQVHGCYSVLRELQALHDHLLSRFNADATLEPADVLVMVPDINTYAPVIEAVFGSVGSEPDGPDRNRRIPWSVADQSLTQAAAVVSLVQRVVELPASRFEASEVLALAAEPPIARRFGFDDTAIAQLRLWLRETGIRRTLSGDEVALFEVPSAAPHSWDFGLRRLLLGRAMPIDAGAVGDCLPWPHIEGDQVDVLSRTLQFLDALKDAREQLTQARTVVDWVELLNTLIERLLLPDDAEADALAQMRELLASLANDAERAEYDATLSHTVFSEILNDTLAGATQKNHRYLTGRVTFSSMVPLRSVPFRRVCLLGLNDGDFPRNRSGFGFDLITQFPERGDRSVRDDDRYLFLEAILSARDGLYLSWIYRNASDNTVREPSVLLSEFRDYLAARFGGLAPQVIEHPLQPFSPQHYNSATLALHSYAAEWAAPSQAPRPVDVTATGQAVPVAGVIALTDLNRFWRNPSQWYCTRVLGLALKGEESAPEDSEPFTLDALDRYSIRSTLIAEHLDPDSTADARHRQLALAGMLPHGALGDLVFEHVDNTAQAVAERLLALNASPCDDSDIRLVLDGWTVTGRLRQRVRWPDGGVGVLHSRASGPKGSDLVALALAHLVGSATGVLDGDAVFVGLDKSLTVSAVTPETAMACLQPWIGGWAEGQSAAVPFFANTSPTFLEAIKAKPESVWYRGGHADAPPGESDNEAVALLYPDSNAVLERDDVKAWVERLLGGLVVVTS